MWYERAIDNLQHGRIYQRCDIVSILKKEKDTLSDNSYIWIIGELVKRGLLSHEGRNRYALVDGKKKGNYRPLYSEEALHIRNLVEKKYPLIRFTVFESVLLNEFLNHQIARNTIFLQVERDVGAFVFDFLRGELDETIIYRPSRKEYSRYWQPDSIVVTDWISEAPFFRALPHDITLEKILVDIFCDKAIQLTYNHAEYKTVVETAYERYNVDTVRLLRYARRRNKGKEIGAFIPERELKKMLSRDNFTRDHIEELRKVNGNAPELLERTVYAFGLLEAIRRAGMPFIFKGGTALLLLLDEPMRLSTDIDLIVEPGVDVDAYIREAGKIFPFLNSEENIRIGLNNMEKRHYKFLYKSPLTSRSFNILLDVLFEENPYSTLVERPIKNSLLITTGEDLTVSVPGINCILGDKLTAFAPHTTGIPFGIGKELEVMKQMYDCWTLFRGMNDFKEVEKVYKNVVQKELHYRALDLAPQDVLSDTVRSCICLMGRGSVDKAEYPFYADGIDRIQGHIFSGVFNGENAGVHACSILYLVAYAGWA